MKPSVIFVHGIRTSRTMWRAQVAHLADRGVTAHALDLPGHGARMAESFSLAGAFATIDDAVQDAAAHGPVILVGHSMGGLLCVAYTGQETPPPVTAFIGASCTALPRGPALRTYRALAGRLDALPDRGSWLSRQLLAVTLPEETRSDFGAGGYALDAQDTALASLSALELAEDAARIRIPVWFVNGQFDQLRSHERLFRRLVPHAELIVVPRTSHLVTAMRPRVFNAVLDVAVATVEAGGSPHA